MSIEDARQWPLVEVCDPSTTRGLYVCWFQMDPRTSRWYLSWASHIPDGPISTMVEQVKQERRFIRPNPPDICIMDAKGGGFRIDKERDEDWFQRFRAHGLDYTPNDEPSPLEELDEWFRLTFDPVLGKAVPRLMICERVAAIPHGPLWALQRFRYDPIGMSHKEFLQQPGKDWVDCCKYLVNQRSINRKRLSKDREAARGRSLARHQKLANSYGFGKRTSVATRQRLMRLPSYR